MIYDKRYNNIVALIGNTYEHFKGQRYVITKPVYDATADQWLIGYEQADGRVETLFTRTWEDFFGEIKRSRFERLV